MLKLLNSEDNLVYQNLLVEWGIFASKNPFSTDFSRLMVFHNNIVVCVKYSELFIVEIVRSLIIF